MSGLMGYGQSIRRGVAPMAKSLLFRTGALRAVRTLWPSDMLAILRYHAICGSEGHTYADPSICVTPAAFERHISYMASCYRILPLPEAVEYIRAGKSLPPKAVAITFDDGYADNLSAARVLSKHGVSGTFYLTADCISGESPFWPSEVRQLVSQVQGPAIRLRALGTDLVVPSGTDRERREAVRTLSRLFKSNTIPVRERLRAELRAAAGAAVVRSSMLTWDEVREIHRLGMTIGAHTLTHPNLPSAGTQDARHEVAGSKKRLEEEIGALVTMFSYPNGGAERYMTRETAEIVRQAGFRAATTSFNGFAGRASDLFALERIQVAERLDVLIFSLELERFAFKPAPRPAEIRSGVGQQRAEQRRGAAGPR